MGPGPMGPGLMGPGAQGPWDQGLWALGPKMDVIIFTITPFFFEKSFLKNRPFIRPPSLKLGAKMTANGLSSYELFVKMFDLYAFVQ